MASSSIGWQELPYATVPLPLDGSGLVWREMERAECRGTHRVILISGVRTPTDVLRGEETQAIGLFHLVANEVAGDAQLVVMPGTHSKHLYLRAARIEGFRTFMTGELFDVLGRHSILAHSVGHGAAAGAALTGSNRTAFLAGVNEAFELALSAALFRVRTRQLLDGCDVASNRAYLSGVLIGCELSYLRHDPLAEGHVWLCAAAPLDEYYAVALDALGLGGRLAVIGPSDFERLSALGQWVLLRKLLR